MKLILQMLTIAIACIFSSASLADSWAVLQSVTTSNIKLVQGEASRQVQALNLINKVQLSVNTSSQKIIADSLRLQQSSGANSNNQYD